MSSRKPSPQEAAENALIAATAAAGGVPAHIVEAAVRPRPQSVGSSKRSEGEQDASGAILEQEVKKQQQKKP